MDIFDVSNLSDNELGHLEFVLSSPSYARVFRPFLMARKERAITLLLDGSENRKRQYSDELLRERANAVGDLVTLFDKIVAESQVERIHMARLASSSDPHTEAVATGMIGPAGVSRLDDGYAPDEEF